jgi:hypothetical protein
MKNTLIYVMCIALTCSCASTNTLKIHNLANYQKNSPMIVFLDFKITKVGEADNVVMSNAILGVGEMRPNMIESTSEIKVKVVLKGDNDETIDEWLVDYPINRSVELMDEKSGKIERKNLENLEGTVNVKFQQNAKHKSFELYRIEPDKKSTKIFNISLKP